MKRGILRIAHPERVEAGTLLLLGALLLAPSAAHAADAPPPPIHIAIFHSAACDHCEAVQRDTLETLATEHDCNVILHYHDVEQPAEYEKLVALEKRLGVSGAKFPAVFIGDTLLSGLNKIEAELEPLMISLRDSGAPKLDLDKLSPPEPEPDAGRESAIYLAYFREPGCRACARVEYALKRLAAGYPRLQIKTFALDNEDSRILIEALGERAGLAPDRRLITPAVFVGDKALVGDALTDAALEELLVSRRVEESPVTWGISEAERNAAEKRLWLRVRNLSVAAVALGGLVDGVNPCAFATLVFFVCCLAGAGGRKRTVLLAGSGFTLGVFATYFLTGIGLSEALLQLDILPGVSAVVTWGLIGLVFLLAALSFRDFLLARSGDAKQMTLMLPKSLRARINLMISRRLHARWLFPAAVGLGATISLLEFVCTGQVYLPLIRYMTSVTGDRVRVLGLLLVYNSAFVLPLVGVLLAVLLGLRSEKLLGFFKRNVATGKILLALFFLLLGGIMLHFQLQGTL